jgi:hypothetical protein
MPHLADRVAGRPLLIHPDKIQVILWALLLTTGNSSRTPHSPQLKNP